MYNLYIIHILNLKTVRIQQFQKNYKYKTPEFEKHKNSANSEIQQKKRDQNSSTIVHTFLESRKTLIYNN